MQYVIASLNQINAKLDHLHTEVALVKEKAEVNETDIRNAFGEIFKLKDTINTLEQKDRALTIRLFGVPMEKEEKDGADTKSTAKVAFDRILKPIFSLAKDNSQIPETTPLTATATITDAYRLKPRNATSNKPAPIVIKLASASLKTAIFKNRLAAMPQPNGAEVERGIRRFHLAEDLTPATYAFLMELRDHDKVERAWSTDGQVRYTITGDKTSYVHKVKSIFDPIDNLFS